MHQRKNLVLTLLKKTQHFCLRLHYNVDKSYFFVHGKEIFKFKAKNVNFPIQFGLGSTSDRFLLLSL